MLDFQVKSGFAHPPSPPICLQPSLPVAASPVPSPDTLRRVLSMLIEPSHHPMQGTHLTFSRTGCRHLSRDLVLSVSLECLAFFLIPPWLSGTEKTGAWPVLTSLMLSGASHASLVPDCNVGLSVCPSTAPGALPGTPNSARCSRHQCKFVE